jgi:hypothetical protein
MTFTYCTPFSKKRIIRCFTLFQKLISYHTTGDHKPVLIRIAFSALVVFLSIAPAFSQQQPMQLWFDKPAFQPAVFTYNAKVFKQPFHFEEQGWMEALPVGNGRMGAVIFGGVFKERIQLNEESLWEGDRHDAANPGSAKALPEVQRLMFEPRFCNSRYTIQPQRHQVPAGGFCIAPGKCDCGEI